MEFVLTSEEQSLLVKLLEGRERELLHEISRTHHREFKVALQKDEKLLAGILNKLRAARPAESILTCP